MYTTPIINEVYQYNAVTIKYTQCSQCLQSRYNLHLPSLSPSALNLGSDQSTSQRALSEVFLLFRVGLGAGHCRFCTLHTSDCRTTALSHPILNFLTALFQDTHSFDLLIRNFGNMFYVFLALSS